MIRSISGLWSCWDHFLVSVLSAVFQSAWFITYHNMRVGVSYPKLDTGVIYFVKHVPNVLVNYSMSTYLLLTHGLMLKIWINVLLPVLSLSFLISERDLLHSVVTELLSSLDLLSKLTGSTSREIWLLRGPRCPTQWVDRDPDLIGRAWSRDQHHLGAPVWLRMVKVVNSELLWPCSFLPSWPELRGTPQRQVVANHSAQLLSLK